MSVELTIHGTGSGMCCLTGKESEGLTVSFKDGTITESFLSWKGFQQLLGMKAGTSLKKPVTPPPTVPAPATTGGSGAGPK